MDEVLGKLPLEGLYKVLDHVVGLMERAEHRTEVGNRNAFRYLPKYSVLLKGKIAALGSNKDELIAMIKVVYNDSYVRMLQKYEEVAGLPNNTPISIPDSTSGRASETTAPSPFSEAPAMSPMSAPTPTSPSLWNTFNLAAARAAKRAKKGGATKRQTKRSRRKRRH
jgi:hypothetical protein